jgi:uncharacterized protein DUF4145
MSDDMSDVWCGEVFAKGLRKSLIGVLDEYHAQAEDYYFDLTCKNTQQDELLSQRHELLSFAQDLIRATEQFGSVDSRKVAESFVAMLLRQEQRDEKLGLLAFVQDVAYSVFSREALGLADGAVARFWDLLTLMSQISTSGRTLAFLRRVSRCYLLGFDAECAIMCRGVLDAELESHIARDDVLDTADSSNYSLDNRIVTAKRRKVISLEAAKKAHRIREVGNHSVHARPEQPKDVLRIIKDTIFVINELPERKAIAEGS